MTERLNFLLAELFYSDNSWKCTTEEARIKSATSPLGRSCNSSLLCILLLNVTAREQLLLKLSQK